MTPLTIFLYGVSIACAVVAARLLWALSDLVLALVHGWLNAEQK